MIVLFFGFSLLLMLADIIVIITENKLYAGTFIRKLRYLVYSITPERYIFIMVLSAIVGLIIRLELKNILLSEMLLLIGMSLTYTRKISTIKVKKKKSAMAEKLKPIMQKKG